MNFIQVFSKELKDKLIQNGFNLLSDNGNFSIFENNKCINFNFAEVDKKQFTLTNIMTF